MTRPKGFGLGLRPQHYQDVLAGNANVDWFEIISENYMVDGGRPLANLMAIRERYPIAMHGVSLSIGSTDPLDLDYLDRLRDLSVRLEPLAVSDHLCWTGVAGLNTHDLLPLSMNEQSLRHVCARVDQVQERLGRPIALENASTYVQFSDSDIPEWEFMAAVAGRTGCQILFDINNVYVNAFNQGLDADRYVDSMSCEAIAYVHLAGHANYETHIVDTHDQAVIDPVWQLYRRLMVRAPDLPTMIERDDRIPPFADLVRELDHARMIAEQARATTRAIAS